MAGWTDAANLQLSVVQELKAAKAKCEDLQAERDRMWQAQNDSDLLQAQISCSSMLDRLDASTLRLSEQLCSTLQQAAESRAHGLGLLGRNAMQIERLEGHLMQCAAEREVDAARQRRLEKEVIELKTNAGMLIADKALLEREVQQLNEQLSAVAPTKKQQASVHSASAPERNAALALVEADQMCEDVKQIAEEMQGAHAHACAKALAALSCQKTRCLAQMQVQAINAKALEDQVRVTEEMSAELRAKLDLAESKLQVAHECHKEDMAKWKQSRDTLEADCATLTQQLSASNQQLSLVSSRLRASVGRVGELERELIEASFKASEDETRLCAATQSLSDLQDQLDATRKQHIQAISEFTGKEQQARRELEKVRHHVHDLALVQKEIWEELQHAAAGLNTDLQYVERMAAAERSQMQQQTRALQEACSREWLSMEQQRVVDTELLEKELAAAAQREKVLEDRLMAELKSREDERVRAAQERAQAQAAVQDERSFWAENKSRLESLVAIYKQAMSGLAAEVMDVAVDVGDWAESMRGGLAHGQAKLKTFSLFMHEIQCTLDCLVAELANITAAAVEVHAGLQAHDYSRRSQATAQRMRADAVAQSAQMVVGHISAAVSEVQMCHVDMVASQQTHEEAQRSRAEMRKLLQVREERHSHVEHELFELQNSFATLQDHMALSQERCAAAAEQTTMLEQKLFETQSALTELETRYCALQESADHQQRELTDAQEVAAALQRSRTLQGREEGLQYASLLQSWHVEKGELLRQRAQLLADAEAVERVRAKQERQRWRERQKKEDELEAARAAAMQHIEQIVDGLFVCGVELAESRMQMQQDAYELERQRQDIKKSLAGQDSKHLPCSTNARQG